MLIGLIFTCLLLELNTAIASDKKILIASTEHPPCSGKTLPNRGACIELFKAAYSRMGYDITIVFYPWKRALKMAQKGRTDGVGPLWHTPDRARKLLFSHGLNTNNKVVFFKDKKKSIQVQTFDDLTPYSVGFVLGYAYSEKLFKSGYTYKRINTYNPIQLIERLVQNKVDLAVLDKLQGEFILKTYFPEYIERFHSLEPHIQIVDEYLAISKQVENAQRKLDDFNTGLTLIRRDGTADRIFRQHGMKPNGQ